VLSYTAAELEAEREALDRYQWEAAERSRRQILERQEKLAATFALGDVIAKAAATMLVTTTPVMVPATDLVKYLREKLAATRVETEALRAASTDNKWVWFSSQDSSPTQSVADSSWAANTYKLHLLPDYRAVKSACFSSLAVRPLNCLAAILHVPIGGFTND
jgi:hypothetical protein